MPIQDRYALACRGNAAKDALRALSSDPGHTVRRAVAKNHKTEPDVLRQLAFDTDGDVRAEAVKNPNTSAQDRSAVYSMTTNWMVRRTCLKKNIHPDLAVHIARHGNLQERVELASHSQHLTRPCRAVLIADPDPAVRAKFAQTWAPNQPNTQYRLWKNEMETLAADPSPAVRETLAANIPFGAPAETALALLAGDELLCVADTLARRARPNAVHTPRSALVAFGASPHLPVRLRTVQNHHNLPVVTQQALANDPASSVRAALAEHATSVDVCQQLSRDPDPQVRAAVASRCADTRLRDTLEHLLADPDGSVRANAATATTNATVERIADERDHAVLRRVPTYLLTVDQFDSLTSVPDAIITASTGKVTTRHVTDRNLILSPTAVESLIRMPLSEAMTDRLSRHVDRLTRQMWTPLVASPHTDSQTIVRVLKLADDAKERGPLRTYLAHHRPNTAVVDGYLPKNLTAAVTESTNAPAAWLHNAVLTDKSNRVRMAVAHHHNAGQDTLRHLMLDAPSLYLAEAVVAHPNCPADVLTFAAERWDNPHLLRAISDHRNCDDHTRLVIALAL